MVWCLREILSRILGSSQLLSSSNTKSVEIYYTRPWNRIIWHSCMECQGREILLCLLTYIILFLRNISNGMKISHFEILFYFGIESLSKAAEVLQDILYQSIVNNIRRSTGALKINLDSGSFLQYSVATLALFISVNCQLFVYLAHVMWHL